MSVKSIYSKVLKCLPKSKVKKAEPDLVDLFFKKKEPAKTGSLGN